MKEFLKDTIGQLVVVSITMLGAGMCLLLIITFQSCSEPNVKSQKTDYVLDGGGTTIKVIEIDGCEYLHFPSVDNAGVTHKGNCKNH